MKRVLTTIIFLSLATSIFAGGTDPIYKLAPVKIRETQARPDLPGILKFEIGWNFLQDEPAPFAINSFGSRTVNIHYSYEFPIGNFGLHIVPGLGLGLDRYKFDNDFTLAQAEDGTVTFEDISELDPKKSHLIANYIDIPLEFRFYVNKDYPKRSFHFGIGGKFSILMNSHTKVKYDDGDEKVIDKEKRSYGLNPFRYGVIGRIGYGGVSIFGYWNLSELFEDGPAGTLDTTNFTIGLGLNLF